MVKVMAMDFTQSSKDYLRQIDAEVERLQQLRSQVASTIQSEEALETAPRRGMSEAGRRAIAAAQKERWAKKKAAGKKVSGKKTAVTTAPITSEKKSSTKKTSAKKTSPVA
ncbi:MAG: hypothetical protein ACRYFU_08425 [Janthinobacterium lividum]